MELLNVAAGTLVQVIGFKPCICIEGHFMYRFKLLLQILFDVVDGVGGVFDGLLEVLVFSVAFMNGAEHFTELFTGILCLVQEL